MKFNRITLYAPIDFSILITTFIWLHPPHFKIKFYICSFLMIGQWLMRILMICFFGDGWRTVAVSTGPLMSSQFYPIRSVVYQQNVLSPQIRNPISRYSLGFRDFSPQPNPVSFQCTCWWPSNFWTSHVGTFFSRLQRSLLLGCINYFPCIKGFLWAIKLFFTLLGRASLIRVW